MDKANNKLFVFKLASILFTITFVATLLLTLCNYITKDKIALINEQNSQKAKQEVIANAKFEKIVLPDSTIKELEEKYSFVSADKAITNGEFSGYCISVAPQGFGGEISMIVGIDANMNYTGIKIVSMAETPGLGGKIQETEFYSQFSQGKKGSLSVVKNNPSPSDNESQAICGATISSKAVVTGANNALEAAKVIAKEAE